MSKKYVLLDLIEAGGEYTYGFVNDENLVNIIQEKIDSEDEIELEFDFEDENDDEQSFNWYDYDQVLHCYGPNVSYRTSCEINILEDEKDFSYDPKYDQTEETIYTTIEDLGINIFTIENPETYNEDKYINQHEDFSIEVGGYRIEKRMHFPILIPINKDKINYSNLFIGSINLDETYENLE